MPGPQQRRKTKLISKADLSQKFNLELAGLKEEFRRISGNCEQTGREAFAVLQDIRTVQGQRRIKRQNLQ